MKKALGACCIVSEPKEPKPVRSEYPSMGSGWRRVRIALGLTVCASAAREFDLLPSENADPAAASQTQRCQSLSNPRSQSRIAGSMRSAEGESDLNEAPVPLSLQSPPSKLGRFRSTSRISRSTCAICLETMKPGHGHAIFTAECSHAFHFPCIASNVRHGNLICPVCRATWNEVPWQVPTGLHKNETKAVENGETSGQSSNPRPRMMTARQQEALRNAEEEQRRMEPVLRILDESIASFRGDGQPNSQEPASYDDDEPLCTNFASNNEEKDRGTSCMHRIRSTNIEIALHPEVEAVTAANTCNLTVLVHLKAAQRTLQNTETTSSDLTSRGRAAIDLVTVLDVSGSMSGTKLTLLKRAMAFVISNLSPVDRLSIVVFSSTARRVLPLRRMCPDGQRSARRVIDRLVCTGGTNISEGLKKGSKVLEDRREKNPVASIMLLSDGQNTYCLTPRSATERRAPLRQSSQYGHGQIPVHAFGFGVDHDAATMHRISEESGGTFSFIQAESLVQDAFAQCLGGLLSVVVQDVQLTISRQSDGVQLRNIHAGSYQTDILADGIDGTVKLGDLYADEDRHVLVDIKIPSTKDFSMNVIGINSTYRDPVSQQVMQTERQVLSISRPDAVHDRAAAIPNLEVERQRNRLRAGKAIAEARSLADRSKISEAQQVLQRAKAALSGTRDELCKELEAELTEIQSRMINRQTYDRSGRAYVLSAQNSHMRQRATTRGESIDSSFSREYQTPSMLNMITRSQSISMEYNMNHEDHAPTTSAWKVADKLAKVAVLRKSSIKVSDLHGFEKAGF